MFMVPMVYRQVRAEHADQLNGLRASLASAESKHLILASAHASLQSELAVSQASCRSAEAEIAVSRAGCHTAEAALKHQEDIQAQAEQQHQARLTALRTELESRLTREQKQFQSLVAELTREHQNGLDAEAGFTSQLQQGEAARAELQLQLDAFAERDAAHEAEKTSLRSQLDSCSQVSHDLPSLPGYTIRDRPVVSLHHPAISRHPCLLIYMDFCIYVYRSCRLQAVTATASLSSYTA